MATTIFKSNKVTITRYWDAGSGRYYQVAVQDDDGRWHHVQLLQGELVQLYHLLREELA